MPACDGTTCAVSIPWRLTPSGLQHPEGNVGGFEEQAIRNALQAVLADAGVSHVMPAQTKIVAKNLCENCWVKQAAAWGDVATYRPARARTTAAGMFFQVRDIAFIDPATKHWSKPAILSCGVHELMHLWSWQSVGLQAYNRVIGGVDWDEAVTDVVAYRVYKRLFAGSTLTSYATPYNQFCKCIDLTGAKFMTICAKFKRDAALRAHLPPPVADYFASLPDGALKPEQKTAAADLLKGEVLRYLLTWYFRGSNAPVSDAKGRAITIDSFLRGYGEFAPLQAAFPSYDGNNTHHGMM